MEREREGWRGGTEPTPTCPILLPQPHAYSITPFTAVRSPICSEQAQGSSKTNQKKTIFQYIKKKKKPQNSSPNNVRPLSAPSATPSPQLRPLLHPRRPGLGLHHPLHPPRRPLPPPGPAPVPRLAGRPGQPPPLPPLRRLLRRRRPAPEPPLRRAPAAQPHRQRLVLSAHRAGRYVLFPVFLSSFIHLIYLPFFCLPSPPISSNHVFDESETLTIG